MADFVWQVCHGVMSDIGRKATAAHWVAFAALSLTSAVGAGCRVMHGAREIGQVEQMVRVEGTVSGPASAEDRPVIVAVFAATEAAEKKWALYHYSVLAHAGPYQFQLPPRAYTLWAFEDADGDFVLDPEEARGTVADGEALELEPKTFHSGLDITLRPPEGPSPVAIDLSVGSDNPELTPAVRGVGEITTLEDARFRPEMQVYGTWRPVSSVRHGQLGLFMLQAYDPCRIPLLFVHGMSGSPRQFATLIESLDTQTFQPWVLSYPSSLRLPHLSRYLRDALRELSLRHGFREVAVVAHSMGGLIARDAIAQLAGPKAAVTVPIFLSLSTPWNGHRGAATAVESSPVVIPSWIDMVPDSAFITQLFRKRLGPATEHHLWFGYKDGDSGDGSVSIASMIDPRAQRGAASFKGFPAGHKAILEDPAVLAHFRTLMAVAKPHFAGADATACAPALPRSASESPPRASR